MSVVQEGTLFASASQNRKNMYRSQNVQCNHGVIRSYLDTFDPLTCYEYHKVFPLTLTTTLLSSLSLVMSTIKYFP
jgi:hypothetical protein